MRVKRKRRSPLITKSILRMPLPASHQLLNKLHPSNFGCLPEEIGSQKIRNFYQTRKLPMCWTTEMSHNILKIKIKQRHTLAPLTTGRRRVLAFKASMAPDKEFEWSLSIGPHSSKYMICTHQVNQFSMCSLTDEL